MKQLVLLIVSIILVSCSSIQKHELSNIDNDYAASNLPMDVVLNQQETPVYILGGKNSCFKSYNNDDEIITTTPRDISLVMALIYRSTGTFTLRKETHDYGRVTTLHAYDNMKIHYKSANCTKKWFGFFHNNDVHLVSYKIINKEVIP